MHLIRHCTVAVLALTIGAAASAQPAPAGQAAAPQPGDAVYAIFLGGREVGREQVGLARSGGDWIISSTGRSAAPIDLTLNRFEARYSGDWQPIELRIEARMRDRQLSLSTSFSLTNAINEITQNGVTNSKTDQVSARTVVLPNNFFAAYEALAARLSGLEAGAELPVYVAPQAEVKLVVRSVTGGQVQTPSGGVNTRRYAVTFHNPTGPLDAELTIDDRNRFARLEIAAATLLVTRQDLASVATRSQTVRNPTDTDATIQAAGFNIAATVTTPTAAGRLRHPAIVLVAGSGPVDRDGTVAGIPLFAQLAGQLAERGFLVVRYDKRGVGQSGGRTERATLRDYADDLIAVVRWTEKRKDVDKNMLAVAGHSEGASVAILAAPREKKIKALVLMAGMGTTGQELILEQQQHMLEATKVPEAERASKVEMQKRILAAVIAQDGWEGIPAELRELVDSPWYRSLLLFDPAKELARVRQPVLILQGALDTQVRPHHADTLAEYARARKNSPDVHLVHLPGLNHLFVPATTGEVSEYGSLKERAISPDVARIIADWLAGRRSS
jgi:pimeloyl-ACP methyl ester carboxylesterase